MFPAGVWKEEEPAPQAAGWKRGISDLLLEKLNSHQAARTPDKKLPNPDTLCQTGSQRSVAMVAEGFFFFFFLLSCLR